MKKTLYLYLLSLFYILIAFLVSAVLQVFLAKGGVFPVDQGMRGFTSVHFLMIVSIQALVFILLGLVFLRIKGTFVYPMGPQPGFLTVILAFLGLIAVNATAAILLHLLGQQAEQFEDFNRGLLKQQPAVFLVSVALIAPVYEEIVFRGIILGSLVNANPDSKVNKTAAVIFSGILFSILHIEKIDSLAILVPILFLAFYLSFLAVKKESLSLVIIVHMIQNFIAGLVFLYGPDSMPV